MRVRPYTWRMSDLKNVAMAVYGERRRELPVLPKSRNEAHEALKSINLNTNKDESFMMHYTELF
jgi:hypothetical protein